MEGILLASDDEINREDGIALGEHWSHSLFVKFLTFSGYKFSRRESKIEVPGCV